MPDALEVRPGSQASGVSGSFGPCALASTVRTPPGRAPHSERLYTESSRSADRDDAQSPRWFCCGRDAERDEKLIQESPIPYSIVHATQFFEFLKGLADISMVGDKVHLPPLLFQPMAADDVASAVGRIAVGPPVNGIVEIGGPEQFRVDELVRRRLASLKDPREVIADRNARYSGAKISERTLVPGNDARLGETTFETWLIQSGGTARAA